MKKSKFGILLFCSLLAACALVSCSDDKPDYKLIQVGFDDLPDNMKAADLYGANLYGAGYYWLDNLSGLGSKPYNDQYYSGGTAISTFGSSSCTFTREDAANWYLYQMAVDSDDGSGNPGCLTKEACLVAYGNSESEPWGKAATVNFTDSPSTERVIMGLYICNTAYAKSYMTMETGSNVVMSSPLNSYFKVEFKGYDASGNKTGEVEVYLADFRNGSTLGVRNGWIPVSLESLGKIHTLEIDMESSDKGPYGINTPTYVAIDDIVIRAEYSEVISGNKNNIE